MTVGFEFSNYRGQPWRVVEAQHQVATMQLADSLADQAMLEDILEASKPPSPVECDGLHYLAATPFRYRSQHPSRFRAAGRRGVWYGAAQLETSLVEVAYHRHRFWAASAAPAPRRPLLMTGFRGRVRCKRLFDTSEPGQQIDAHNLFCEPPYGPTIALAEQAQAAGAQAIRYTSLRCRQLQQRDRQTCYAVLTPGAFESDGVQAGSERNFALHVSARGVDVLATTGPERIALRIPPN